MSRDTIRRAFTEKRRAYIYRVLTAATPLLTVYGIADDSTVALWLALAGTVLGLTLATANTSTGSKGEDGAGELGTIISLLVVVILVLVVLALLGVGVDVR